ncbi:ankyrin repeat-containing domain protein [Mycena albidolilacea]|uniref:Ankyrin repeat-containing domain protein n=1 Tax=Mycena albidolilacea TaxID=1033008 RepID=A0AAD7F046_9AGAR|nr:ankyrin repeat-containing domain protein [Mycena albidolilacea]
MAVFSDLPPELVLHIVSFLTRETILDPDHCLMSYNDQPELVPDLPSLNSLSQTNIASYRTVDPTMYQLCASVEILRKLAFLFAVQNQLESTLDKFIAAEVTPDLGTELDFQPDGASLLHIAARLGFRPMVVKLLGMYGEEMVYRPTAGYPFQTALSYAAQHGHIEIVHLLAPVPTSSPVFSRSLYLGGALIKAVRAGNAEISEYLISVGADVNFQNICSALWYAASSNQLASVQLLLAAGADPNLCLPFPLFTAARFGYLDIVQALVDGGADINDRDISNCNVLVQVPSIELLLFFLEHGVDPNNADDEGNTVLHAVCGKQHNKYGTAFVQLLCEFGAIPDKTNIHGWTAADSALTNGTPEIVEILEPYVQTPALQAKISRWREKRKAELQRTAGKLSSIILGIQDWMYPQS